MNHKSFHPELKQRVLRFSISGLLVTAIHVAIASTFIEVILPEPAIANGLAFTFATIISYLINTTWSFSSRLHGKTLLRFSIVSFIGMALAMSLSGTAEFFGLHYWYGIAAVVLFVPPTTFILHNFWTYR